MIAAMHDAGATVASICTGAMIFPAAGLPEAVLPRPITARVTTSFGRGRCWWTPGSSTMVT